MQLRYNFNNKYTLTIESRVYMDTKLYEHEVELYKNGTLLRSMFTVINKNKTYDPWKLYEMFELYLWAGIKTEQWEMAINMLHEEHTKVIYRKTKSKQYDK